MSRYRRLIALLLAGSGAIAMAVWARQAYGPDRYRSYTKSQLEAVLARSPNDALALHQLGLRYRDERRFTEARRTLERAFAARPGSATIANDLGQVCAHLHDFPTARLHFEQAIQLDPNMAAAHRNLGDMLGVAGDYVRAVASYERALKLKPDDVETLVALGSAYGDAQNQGRAIKTLQRAIQLAPNSAAAYQGLGRTYLRFRRYREAREALQKAAALDPTDAHTAGFLGLAYAEQISGPEDAREALVQVERAKSLGYTAAEADYARGLVHLYLKQYDLAIASLEAATRADPGAENMAYQLAQAYLAAGKKAEGERAMAQFRLLVRTRDELLRLRQQVQNAPADVAARRRLAEICLQTGRASEALRHYTVLNRMQPTDVGVLRGLADAAAAAGNKELAAQAKATLERIGTQRDVAGAAGIKSP
jgi:tetratricopeptide (TPR) repeat protein